MTTNQGRGSAHLEADHQTDRTVHRNGLAEQSKVTANQNDTPAWGDPVKGRFCRMRNGRLTAYWATLSPVALNSEDFGKVF